MIFDKSKCRNSWLHRYEIVQEYANGIQERCLICGSKVAFRIIDGKVNNKNYLSYHMRQALPLEHRLFAHEYPNYGR